MGLLRGPRRALLSGGITSIFPLANPVTGTLYPATSDGTFTAAVTLPGSPDYLTRIELGVRVGSFDTTNTWEFYDAWVIRAEYQTDATWDVKAGSVSGGVESFTLTATDVGNITHLRWVTSGNTLQAYYEINNSGSYVQIGGDITSATHQSNTQVGVSYFGFTSANYVTNGTFDTDTDWTKESSWTITGGEAVYDGVTAGDAIYQAIAGAAGVDLRLVFSCSANTRFALFRDTSSGFWIGYTSYGAGTQEIYTTGPSGTTHFYVDASNSLGAWTIDNIYLGEYGTLDNPSDGILLLEAA